MNFLSIDFSTDIGSLFLKIKNRTFLKNLQNYPNNSDTLMNQILEFLKENNTTIENISEIYVNQGPGSFSGLRGSISTAKGICLAKNLSLYGYNSFLCCGIKYYNFPGPICCILNFKGKFFMQKFNKNLEFNSTPRVVTIKELIENFNEDFKVTTKNLLNNFDKEILNLKNLHIVNLDYESLLFLKEKNLLESKSIKPLYLS